MLKPTAGINGIKEFILESVEKAGPNPCPPIVVGVGIGGTFEKAALLSKKSLLREIGKNNSDKNLAELESSLLKDINNLDIGPQGFGGLTTALAVNIESYPTHIAALPVAINISCHASRHQSQVFS
jgi:fumarate hydratase subunit alpha